MSEQSRYLNAEESRQVREFSDQYRGDDQPSDADQVIDDLDRILLKSEPINTIELVNSLLTQRTLEAQQRGQQSSIPERVRASINADDAMADLDDCLWQNVRDSSPLSEDGGWGHLDKVVGEIEAGHKARRKDEARAAKERQATARRFMGTGFSQERSISAAEFYRGKGKR
jgi:hypothetical protein